jgi:hypothetical protein
MDAPRHRFAQIDPNPWVVVLIACLVQLPLVAAPVAENQPATMTQVMNAMPGRSGNIFDTCFTGRVLVVEDNTVNQKVAKKILERLGCEVVIANNGAEAIEHLDAVAKIKTEQRITNPKAGMRLGKADHREGLYRTVS